LIKSFAKQLIQELNLPESRYDSICKFLETVSYYKLLPYIEFIKNNQNIENDFKLNIKGYKDLWDGVTELYRYNIKLSIAVYPYIYVLETALKNKINNYLCEKLDKNWYTNQDLYNNASKNTREYLSDFNNKYLKEAKNPENGDFLENYTMFGYWTATLKVPNLWDSKNIKLKQIFINGSIKDLISVPTREVYDKLVSINDLRNNISHHNQIILKEISSRTKHKYKLWDIYQNINWILEHLGCENIDWVIGDLSCNLNENCTKRTFETLYKEFEFIHK